MVKIILLLTPIYVTLFWSIVLNTDNHKFSNARLFLGKFMIFAVIVYISHFLFYIPFPNLYVLIDPIYQYASLLVYPLYHIYFRLLFIDKKFSLNIHFPYLIAPTIFFILYSAGVFFTSHLDFKLWLFENKYLSNSPEIQYLNLIHLLIRITFLAQVIGTVIGNQNLIKKYGKKAEQFYSDYEDSRTSKVQILNISMIITAFASFVLGVLGRDYFSNEITGIAIASLIFSSMLFLIGWLGDKQKTLNPTYEISNETKIYTQIEEFSSLTQKKMLDKVLKLFNDEKVYMNNKLNIQDIAQAVGTNRTYISTIINQQFNQNFCSFVNNFRVEELEKVIKSHPEFTNQLLSESCGFGSVDSMKRAISAKTELTLNEWKKSTFNKSKEVKIQS